MQTNIHVAMMIDCYGGEFVGGGQTYLTNLIKGLEAKYPCKISLFSQKKPSMLHRLLWNIWIIPKVYQEHKKNPFHIIHAQAFTAGIAGKILGILLGLPVIYSVHGSHTLDMVKYGFEQKSWKYYVENILLTKIKYDREISVSANFLNYKNINKNIAVIENGADIKSITMQKTGSNYKKEIVLLFIGRLEKIKGINILLQALAQLRNNLPIFELRIVGDGSLKKSLQKLTNDLNLTEYVKFVGTKRGLEMAKEYAEADLFILPSIAEGQPIVLLDAWSYKLPVLVTTAGHNPWMVENNKDGYLVKAGSVSALTEGLKTAIKNRSLWKNIGEAGHKKVTSQYTWDITARKTYQIYESIKMK